MLHKLFEGIGVKLLRHLSPLQLPTCMKIRGMATTQMQVRNMEETKIKVDGVNINYVRVGTGQPVLLLPGAIGSIWTDFRPQIEGLDHQKFTVVAWDPPGYGKSRPPDRTFPDDFYERDAEWAVSLMKALSYDKYSLIGWSDGAITSLIIAGTHPDKINKLVSLAGNAYIGEKDFEIYTKFKNIDTWSDKMRGPYIEVYGEKYVRNTWSDYVNTLSRIYKNKKGNVCKDFLPKIECPTLIIQGMKDVMVGSEHAYFINSHVTGSKLKTFEKGAHNLHLRYPEEFNALITEFLTEEIKQPSYSQDDQLM